jgi:hypothetical protein
MLLEAEMLAEAVKFNSNGVDADAGGDAVDAVYDILIRGLTACEMISDDNRKQWTSRRR